LNFVRMSKFTVHMMVSKHVCTLGTKFCSIFNFNYSSLFSLVSSPVALPDDTVMLWSGSDQPVQHLVPEWRDEDRCGVETDLWPLCWCRMFWWLVGWCSWCCSHPIVQICWDESEGGKDPLGLAPDQFGHIQMFGRQQRLSGTQDKSGISS